MLFNSYTFIFYFLPVVFVVYFLLNKTKKTIFSRIWLVASSLFFYSWWNIAYLPLIVGSLVGNYIIGQRLPIIESISGKKKLLTIGIILNVLLLGYFKYYDFFLSNVNLAFKSDFPLLELALPLAISFFTFQQIAYLVDAYRGETKGYNFINYALFVTFFPQLIAGPIVHHAEVMGQFDDPAKKRINLNNISKGLFIFFIGLFKKVVIADTFAVWATNGFDDSISLTFFDGWLTSLSYTFQLYFDFSGYCDMAIGAALMFNIVLPINFNSPYKALNIQDFWRRWHMTLNRFLTNYLYIPLGGSRKGKVRTYINILIIFFVSGLWHGAGWTFVFWGLLHGFASMINRFWKNRGFKLPTIVAWFITFQLVNFAWVFFRANTWSDAIKVLKGMFGFNGIALPDAMQQVINMVSPIQIAFSQAFLFNTITTVQVAVFVILGLFVVVRMKNSVELMNELQGEWKYVIWASVATVVSILSLNRVSEFLYFNF
ncbi:MBOAT family O-acyltransferase [Fredinandcohnia sp. 179-A 10B2 NHS]|uniref:MBOAT family O-acyltransferase n=1 Tax=Fredinandcohnia sp. 179-A 10B2 NHS TaxID=3235176 RepID=UPI0039A18199